MDNHLTIRLPKRLIKATLVLALVAAVISPIAVSASHVFDDVPDSNVFHEDIAWLANAGITFGCNPPTNTNYCPNDNVTRAQMAAFMRRLAEGQVVDAATALTAGNADNAAMLGGAWPDAYKTVIQGVSCYGTTCVDVPNLTNQKIFELTITAPQAGVLQMHSAVDTEFTTPSNDYVTSWMTLNGDASQFGGCEGSFLGVPLGANKVIGSERIIWADGFIGHTNTAASPAISVPPGTHTLRLCGFSNVNVNTWSGSLSAIWSAEGDGATLSGVGPTEVSAELAARLEAAVNE